MRIVVRLGFLLGIVTAVALPVVLQAGTDDGQGSITIVFKDGHQQHIRLAEITRIDFSPGPAKVAVSHAHFLGEWKVGDGAGGTFLITLKPDGVAQKTLGSKHGKWTVEEGEARISWDDGWHDVIRKVGGTYEKVAFSPGTSYSDQPSNTAQAVYTEAH